MISQLAFLEGNLISSEFDFLGCVAVKMMVTQVNFQSLNLLAYVAGARINRARVIQTCARERSQSREEN